MRRLLLLGLLPGLLGAEDHWVKFASGPFEVWTDASTHVGREDLVRLEQFRHALGEMLGEQDLQAPEPVRILVFKNAKGWTGAAPVVQGRDARGIVFDEKTIPGPAVYTALTELFLEANSARMPASFEHGLIEFFSTFELHGFRLIAGAPPPQPDLDWARVHLLVVDPEYFGKLRVLLFNLRKGVDAGPAYRNAFGKSPAEIEEEAKRHLAAGNFQTTELSSRPLSERDFTERQVSDADARLARADLLAGAQSAAEYEALLRDHVKVAEAEEGLGLLALRDQHKDEAERHFAAAMAAGSSSARCYVEYAKLEPDNEKATQALLRAAGINPKLDEPFALMAARDTDPAKRLAHWKAAAERNPRNAAYWKALAEEYLAVHNYEEASKAWDQAAQAATDPAERERMRQARIAIEGQRLDYEAELRAKEAAHVEELKAEARAEVHALEKKYSEGDAKPDQKPVPWWDGPHPSGKLSGSLKQVDCLGSQIRLVIASDEHKTVRLLIPDPAKIAIAGGGEKTLGCGAQKPRHVSVEYFPKPNSRLATAGEVATIQFQ
jgi:tetratricopeptide (TPR) repeat protein